MVLVIKDVNLSTLDNKQADLHGRHFMAPHLFGRRMIEIRGPDFHCRHGVPFWALSGTTTDARLPLGVCCQERLVEPVQAPE